MISVVIPVLNEESFIGPCLDRLESLPGDIEAIVSDGGSRDGTRAAVESRPWARFLVAPAAGRGLQMNAGARAARGDVLLFLHADMELPEDAVQAVILALADPRVVGGGFLKQYTDAPAAIRPYEWLLNVVRARMMRNLVGTNAIFVRRAVHEELGGFREWPLLEDVDYCDRLKRRGRLAVLPGPVIVSARKYRREGLLHRIWINARVMAGYRLLGRPPEELVRTYRRTAPQDSNDAAVPDLPRVVGEREELSRPPASSLGPGDASRAERSRLPRPSSGSLPRVSVVIPTLDEEAHISSCLQRLAAEAATEVIVADGGSADGTRDAVARFPFATFLPVEASGRARQMNAGAAVATGEILLFLHADSILPPGAIERVRDVLERDRNEGTVAAAFVIRMDHPGWKYRVIESLSNLRNRLLGVPYGDQALALTRETFERAGGYPDQPFLEDIDLGRTLRRMGRIRFLGPPGIVTSARRFRKLGPLLGGARNVFIVLLHALGLSPRTLLRLYSRRSR